MNDSTDILGDATPSSNFDFLFSLFGAAHANDAFVAGFAEDPSGPHDTRTRAKMWRGQRWGALRAPLPREWNNYYCISTFRPSEDPADRGAHRRRKALHTATFVIVFDDVGVKVPWANIKLPPTFSILTSPGNCQVGYRLTVPETDALKVERLIDGLIVSGLATDAKDPGMRGVTRFVRLPFGTNKKSKYGTLGVVCELRDWHPERTYTCEQIAATHNISLVPPVHTGAPRPSLTMTDEQRRAIVETFLAALEAEGMIIGEDANAPGKWHVRCPWIGEHQDGDEGGTAYFEPGYIDRSTGEVSNWGGFKCHHGHCEGRHLRQVISWLREHGHYGVIHPEVAVDFQTVVGRRLPVEYFNALVRNDEEPHGIKTNWKSNAEILILHDTVINAAIKFNEFTNAHEVNEVKLGRGATIDDVVAWIITEIETVEEYSCSFPENTVRLILNRLLTLKRYDPLREWAETAAQTWDGVARLNDMLIKYAGATAQPSEYVRAVTRAFMVGAAWRALVPGYKFDNMLILEGAQGVGKSTLCQVMAPRPGWASAGILDVQNKDAVADLQGKFIYEVEELQMFKRARDMDTLKAFLSRTHDRVRLSYRRDSADYPRRAVFIGTTNKNQYLEDDDGTSQRRFWPVKVEWIDRLWFPRHMPQVWAEALHAAVAGEIPVLEAGVVRLAEAEQLSRAHTIAEHPLYQRLMHLWDDPEYKHRWPSVVTTSEILSMLGFDAQRHDRMHQMLIAQILQEIGYERRRSREQGVQRWRWYDTGKRLLD